MPSSRDERLTGIEMSLAHLQRDFDQLSTVVLKQQSMLEALRRRVEFLQTRIDRVDAAPADPPEAPPPHY